MKHLAFRVALAATLTLGVAAPAMAQTDIGTAVIGGRATWYGASGMIGAAGPALRGYLGKNWRGSLVSVCRTGNDKCVVVKVADWCACPKRLIDLSDDAFAQIAPLSKGVIGVSIETFSIPKPPPTDTAPDGGQVLHDVSNAALFLIGIIAFLCFLVALGTIEPYVNSVMGWDDKHRDARDRNRRR